MTNACFARLRHERGAVLVHVTVAIIGLLAFSALVVDYGVMWIGRRQAQNAADAAALAGAISMAFDAPGATTPRAPWPRRSAREQGLRRRTEYRPGQRRQRASHAGHQLPPCLRGVHADGRRGHLRPRQRLSQRGSRTPLPTFFARLFGMLHARRPGHGYGGDYWRQCDRLHACRWAVIGSMGRRLRRHDRRPPITSTERRVDGIPAGRKTTTTRAPRGHCTFRHTTATRTTTGWTRSRTDYGPAADPEERRRERGTRSGWVRRRSTCRAVGGRSDYRSEHQELQPSAVGIATSSRTATARDGATAHQRQDRCSTGPDRPGRRRLDRRHDPDAHWD